MKNLKFLIGFDYFLSFIAIERFEGFTIYFMLNISGYSIPGKNAIGTFILQKTSELIRELLQSIFGRSSLWPGGCGGRAASGLFGRIFK